MLDIIDRKLQPLYQNTSNFLDDYFGLNKFFLQKWSFIVGIVILVTLIFGNSLYDGEITWSLINSTVLTGYALLNTLSVERYERIFLRTGKVKIRNVDIKFRTAFLLGFFCFTAWATLVISIVMYSIAISDTTYTPIQLQGIILVCLYFGSVISSFFLVMSSFYFGICLPRPPSRSRLNKWLAKLTADLASLGSQQPEPVRISS